MCLHSISNESVASTLQLPDTHFLLDYIRPDLLLLRVVSRSLILWNDVCPTSDWIDSQIPTVVRRGMNSMIRSAKKSLDAVVDEGGDDNDPADFDFQAVRQANAFIVSGACFALGLRYAGTANRDAAAAIIKRALWLMELRDNKDAVSLIQQPDRSTLLTCLCTTAISLAMVMAGTGDLDSFRLFRSLRWQCDENTIYGTHASFGMAIGLLFLGGGKCTLGNSPRDVAMLIAAFYPHMPVNSSDNQYHLQALRHLYVLAVKERILEAIDVDSHEKVCVPIELTLPNSMTVQASTPFLIANNCEFSELRLKTDRYYDVTIDTSDWKDGRIGTLFVKRKAGHMSYLQDPNGLRSLSIQAASTEQETFHKTIKMFSHDASLVTFSKYFCSSVLLEDPSSDRFCSDEIAAAALVKEKADLIALLLRSFRLADHKGGKSINSGAVWDAKLLGTYWSFKRHLGTDMSNWDVNLIPEDYLSIINVCIEESVCFGISLDSDTVMDDWWRANPSLGLYFLWNDVPLRPPSD